MVLCRRQCQSAGMFVCEGQCEMCAGDVLNLTEACQAMGRLYHTNCFICSVCRMSTDLSSLHCHVIWLVVNNCDGQIQIMI